jgi:CheY-like chemotaxis protein
MWHLTVLCSPVCYPPDNATTLGCRRNTMAVFTKPTVLVVEDVPVVRMLLAKLLRGAGFQVVEAANGEDAIRIVEAGRPIQLVLSDVHMPGARIDGLDLARWLHKHRPGLKVIGVPSHQGS